MRILHNLSFVEDPTRIFRAVRFEQRYGFRMEQQTEILAKRAIEMEFVGQLGGARVREELKAILEEDRAASALVRLDELGALSALLPALRLDEKARQRFEELDRRLPEFVAEGAAAGEKKPPRRWLGGMMAFLEDIDADEVTRWTREMRLRREQTNLLLAGVLQVPAIAAELAANDLPNSAVFRRLDPLKGEALAYLYVSGGDAARAAIRRLWSLQAKARLDIGGEDLEHMGLRPSAVFATILEKVRSAHMDGAVGGREEQLRMARDLAAEHDEEGSG